MATRTESTPEWKEESTFARLKRCVTMLYIHGMLTESEADKAKKRIRKEEAKEPPHAALAAYDADADGGEVMTRKLSGRDRAMIAMHGEVAVVQLIEQAAAAARAEAERLRELVAALEAALDQSRCICSTNPCEAFDERCPVHGHKLESPT